MIVPEYWAEAREQARHKGRPITVRRYGWSDDSADVAQALCKRLARNLHDLPSPATTPAEPCGWCGSDSDLLH